MWMTLSFNDTEKCDLGGGIFNQNMQISDTCKTEQILVCFIQFMQSWFYFLGNLICQI